MAAGGRRAASGLHPDEAVLASAAPHWTRIARPAAAAAALVAGAAALELAAPGAPAAVHWAGAGAAAAACIWLGARLVGWRSTRLVVTSQRLVERHGVLRRRAVEVWLARVERVDVVRSLVQRLVGTGELEVAEWGEVDVWAFSHVRKPVMVQRLLTEWSGPRAAGGGWSGGDVWEGEAATSYDPLRGYNPAAHDPGMFDRPGGAAPWHGPPGEWGDEPDGAPYPPGYRPSLDADGPDGRDPWGGPGSEGRYPGPR